MKKKNKQKPRQYDYEYMEAPLHTTMSRAPKGYRSGRTSRVLSVTWFAAGLIAVTVGLTEYFSGPFYTAVVATACGRLAEFFGLEAETLTNMTLPVLTEVKTAIAATSLSLGLLCFVCTYYCRQLVKRANYITRLERAAQQETYMILKDYEFRYQAGTMAGEMVETPAEVSQ